MSPDPLLVIDGLSKTFRPSRGACVAALKDLFLSVNPGELLVVVGPSGCGKTTLLRLIAGLETPDTGRVLLGGRDLRGCTPGERDLAMVFQTPALYPELTAGENLALGLKLRGVPGPEQRDRVKDMAARLKLEDVLDRRPGELSGGQAQRVSLGRALVRRPALLLLDEPLSGLDAPVRAELRRQVAALQQQLGTTMLYVTHDQAEAMALGGRIAVLRNGGVAQVGTPLAIYQHPADVFVAAFFGQPAINLLPGRLRVAGTEVWFRFETGLELRAPGHWARADWNGRELVLGLRPEHLAPAPGIAARVQRLEPTGPDVVVCLDAQGVSLTARWPASAGPRMGGLVQVVLDLSRACVFDRETGRAVP